MHLPSRFLPVRDHLAGLLIAAPLLVWGWALARYAVDVVSNDDYALLIFVARWQNPAHSWSTRLADLMALHNTHRIIYDRLVCLGTYYLTGQFSVKIMIGLGNLSLLGIGWQLWRGFRQLGQPAWYFLPIPCWLFSLQSHENMFWGMAALQNFTVIWFVLETLHQLHRRAPLIWPLLLATAATLTSGNGLLAFVVGTLLLVHQQRRNWSLAVWAGGTLLVLCLMLVVWPVAHERTPVLGWLPNAALLLGGAFTNGMATTGWLFAGGGLLAVAMLLALLFWFANVGRVGQRLQNAPITAEWLAFGLVVLATALLLAMHRLPDELLRERYKVYAHLMLSLVYLLGLAVMAERVRPGWAGAASLLAVVMNVGAFHACLPHVVANFQQRQTDAFNFRHNTTTLPIPYFRSYMDSLLISVDRQGIYSFPDGVAAPATWATLPAADSLTISTFRNDGAGNAYFGMHPRFVQINDQRTERRLRDGTERGVYVVAEAADRHRYLFPATVSKGSLRAFATAGEPFRPGFSTTFFSERLEPGTYRIKVLRIANDRPQLLDVGQTLTIPVIL